MSKYTQLGLLALSLLLASACSTTYNVRIPDANDPEPTAAPTASPTATPKPVSATQPPQPSPSGTPGWTTVVVQGNASNHVILVAEVQRLLQQGQVSGVTSSGFLIRLSGSFQTLAYLKELSNSEAYSFSTLLQSSLDIDNSFTRVFSSGQEFVNFWRQYVTALDPVPGVDFATQSVVAIGPGTRASTGYTTRIQSVRMLNHHLTIRYRVDAPAQSGAPSHLMPVHVIQIPLSGQRGDYNEISFESEP